MCMKQHLGHGCSILNGPHFSMQEKQLKPGLDLIEKCHFITVTFSYIHLNGWTQSTWCPLSSSVQVILMLYSDMYIHILSPILCPGFRLERIKKKSLLLTMHSHSMVSPTPQVSSVLCFQKMSNSLTVLFSFNWWY